MKKLISLEDLITNLPPIAASLPISDKMVKDTVVDIAKEINEFTYSILYASPFEKGPVDASIVTPENAIKLLMDDEPLKWSEEKLAFVKGKRKAGVMCTKYLALYDPKVLLKGKLLARKLLTTFQHLCTLEEITFDDIVHFVCLGNSFFQYQKEIFLQGESETYYYGMQELEEHYKRGEANKIKAEKEYQDIFQNQFLPDWMDGAYDGPKTYLEVIEEIRNDYKDQKVGYNLAKRLYHDANKIRKRIKKV